VSLAAKRAALSDPAVDVAFKALLVFQLAAIDRETGPRFLDPPDRWCCPPRWRCAAGHVSARYVQSERRGDRCLACDAPVLLTFPEDKEET
jgi:hypothetical protein